MAVKLSSYYWFRNNSLVRSLEDRHSARYYFGGDLSSEDKKVLQFIVEELDKLKEDSHFMKGSPVINPSAHVLIPNVVELEDVTSNPELAAAYLLGIHRIMERYWVKTEMYRELGRCFDELELQPDPDLAEAVKYANDKIRFNRYGSLESMCWKNIREYKQKDSLTTQI